MFRLRRLMLVVLVSNSAWAAEPIIVEGVVNAPVAAVWSAFTTSAGLESWLAPHADFELRLGGLMRTHYDANGVLGDEGTIVNEVLSYEPLRMLSIRVRQAPQGFAFVNAVKSMWTVISFEPRGKGRTHLRVVGLGFGDDDESQRMRAFLENGNAYTLKKVQEHFEPTRMKSQ